ncbi:hypothetical protein VQ042_08025 [Aurantimonas sp. A2-1-M11]|uniref:hypothetical protein n=1 Tax=Aurantimonas sp. A2-1-M11 TaxID=3113712 RepID=UPI002F92C99E
MSLVIDATPKTCRPKGRLDVLADQLGIRIIPTWRRRGPNETHARGAFKAIVAEHGEGHLVTVVRCIRETRANRDEMWSETILAISDILAARKDWRDAGGALLDAFDAIPLRSLRESAVALRPWPVRHTLRGLLYARLEAAMATREAA